MLTRWEIGGFHVRYIFGTEVFVRSLAGLHLCKRVVKGVLRRYLDNGGGVYEYTT